MKKLSTLYICYFGLREPLVQTQVLPYLRQMGKGGIEAYLLTFEPDSRNSWSEEDLQYWRERLEAEGIGWFSLPYHKRPTLPATLYDIAAGARLASRLARRYNIDVLHARSHVAAAIGALAKRMSGGRLIFDIRGFFPEEYVDAGRWKEGGYLYRLTKVAERQIMSSVDGFVVLTEQARRILFSEGAETDRFGRPIEVIPCCVDFNRFQSADRVSKADVREELGLAGRRVIVYVGALGGWYLTDEMAEFLATAHRQDAATFSMILTQSPPEMITERLSSLGISERDYLVRRVPPDEVPGYLKAADLAISFIKPCYSKLSSSPTKVAEYLASGLPLVCNAGIGDVDEVIEGDRVGIIIREFNREAYIEALDEAEELRQDDGMAERCRYSAQKRFDLEKVGGARYLRLYRRLAEKQEPESASSRAAL